MLIVVRLKHIVSTGPRVSTGAPPRGGTGRTMLHATSFCERLPPTLFYQLRLVERPSGRDLWVTHTYKIHHLLYCCVCLIGCGSGGPPLDRRGVRAIQQQQLKHKWQLMTRSFSYFWDLTTAAGNELVHIYGFVKLSNLHKSSIYNYHNIN